MSNTIKGMVITSRLATHTGIAERDPEYHEETNLKVNDNTMPSVSDYNFTALDKELNVRNFNNSHAINNSADFIMELKSFNGSATQPPL